MRILLADDDPVIRRLLQALLGKWGYQLTVTDDGSAALAALTGDDPPPLALLDWMMPGMDGVDVVRELRRRGSEPYTYVILLTSRSQRDDIICGLEAGADDYLIKPVHHGELRVRIRAAERLIDLQEALIAAREELRALATTDALTGLLNRRAVLAALEREAHRSVREGYPVTVVMLDLDHFKRVNDTWGHLAGDEVLREAARRIAGAIRIYDLAGRYGGEEFLVIAPRCGVDDAPVLAERIRGAVAASPILAIEQSIPQTISVGVATTPVGWDRAVHALLNAADEALYRAKEAGRDRVEVAELEGPSGE